MTDITITIHEIAVDGLPPLDGMTGRTAFIWDGNIVSGWPLHHLGEPVDHWEPAEDRFGGTVAGVEYWVEFPVPVWDLTKRFKG